MPATPRLMGEDHKLEAAGTIKILLQEKDKVLAIPSLRTAHLMESYNGAGEGLQWPEADS